MDPSVRLRPFVTQDELLQYLHSSRAKPASVRRRLRSRKLISAGIRLPRRRGDDGRVIGATRLYCVLNVLAEALVRAGRNDDAATVARCATRFEAQFAASLTPAGAVAGGGRDRLSDALETLWASCRPADVAELRGVVIDVGDRVQLRTASRVDVLIPRVDGPPALKVGDGIVVIQVKTGAGTWLSRAFPAEQVAAPPDAAGRGGADTDGMFGPDHIEHVTRSSPARDKVLAQLASLAAEQEPARLTLLG